MKKNILFILLLIFVTISTSSAQNFDSIQKMFDKRFDDFKNKSEERYKAFKDSADKDFADMLEKSWHIFKMLPGKTIDTTQDPKEAPVFEPKNTNEQGANIPVKAAENMGEKFTVTEPPILALKSVKVNREVINSLNINYYGREITVDYDKNIIMDIPPKIDEKFIGKYFKGMSSSNINNYILELLKNKEEMGLNDWGYYRLVDKAVNQIVGEGNRNAKVLLTWYILLESKYKDRLGIRNDTLFLVIPSYNILYDIPGFAVGNINFYIFIKKADGIRVYEKDYANADKCFDFYVKAPVNLNDDIGERDIAYNYKGKPYKFVFQYNKSMIEYYKNYPHTDLKVYFDAPASPQLKESIFNELKPLIESKTETQAIGLLLDFVQSLPYKTDEQQFGKQKCFFTDEMLYYPFSDCKKRSVFFAYLVRTLLGNKVIGLDYPGHVATAVKFNTVSNTGNYDYVNYKGETYLICDPTYIGAPIGEAMTEFHNTEPVVVEIASILFKKGFKDIITGKLTEAGCSRGGNKQDMVFDEEGNCYVTGFFKGTANLGKIKLESVENTNDIFIAKFDKTGSLIWVKNMGGPGNDISSNICLDKNNNILIAGTFEKQINYEDFKINTMTTDVFVSKWSKNGKLLWLGKAGTDSIALNKNYIFFAKFDVNGKEKWLKINDQNDDITNFNISADDIGNCFLAGMISKTTTFSKSETKQSEEQFYDLISTIKKENDKLINMAYDKSIAGLFAVINILTKLTSNKVEGKTFQQTLDKYNANFKNQCPNIYKNIGKITAIQNEFGIITINTEDKNDISFSSLKIKNNAQVKLIVANNGDVNVNVLSKIKVGKFGINFDLNYVKLYKDSGNLLFDYDSDHSQKTLNLKKDILD